MAIQKRIAQAGLAKQAVKGTAIANPVYAFGLTEGRVFGSDLTQEAEEVTTDKRVNPGANRLEIIPNAEWTTRGYPRLMGLLLYGALGSISSSGTSPTTHVITPGDDLPYLTHFGRQGAEYFQTPDCKIDELTLSWDGPGPIEVAATLMGRDLTFLASAYTPTNTETDSGGKFRAAGGTFKLDIDSATPVTAPVRAGEISLSNSLEAIVLADSIKPNDVFPGVHESGISLTIKPDNLAMWREIITGSAAGTAIQDTPVYGSFEVKFVLDANTDLVIVASRVPFTADFPEVDPAGGAVELELEGAAYLPAAGTSITATLRNAVASY